MIENKILNLLKNDTELYALLSGKIYPNIAQVKNLPCVVMTADSPSNPTGNPYLYQQNLTFEIYAATEKTAQNIRDRIYEILNKYDNFYLADLTNGIIIKEAHAVFASVSNHFPLDNEQAKEKVVSFDFQFTKCA